MWSWSDLLPGHFLTHIVIDWLLFIQSVQVLSHGLHTYLNLPNEAFRNNKIQKGFQHLHTCTQLHVSILFKFFRKKKKNKAKKVLEDVSHSVSKGGSEESQKKVVTEDTRTPAQIAYDKIQEKRVCTDVHDELNLH